MLTLMILTLQTSILTVTKLALTPEHPLVSHVTKRTSSQDLCGLATSVSRFLAATSRVPFGKERSAGLLQTTTESPTHNGSLRATTSQREECGS